jgi:acetyl-CoA carboxylase carboxyltransferase component
MASYDVRTVISDVLDHDSFLELRGAYAPNMITALGRLDGRPVGVIANQPMIQAGSLDVDAAQKAARFVQWCDCFNFPVITFVDTSGYLPGRDLEWRGIIRHGAQLLHAYAAATVPRLCVVLRKAYGGAYIVMDSRGLGTDWCVAWPTAEIAVMGAEGAVSVLYRDELKSHSDPAARRQELLGKYREEFSTPYLAASRGMVDAVIEPRTTRAYLSVALESLRNKRDLRPQKKHGLIPL